MITTAALTLGLMLTGCSSGPSPEEVTEYSTEMEEEIGDFTNTMTIFYILNTEAVGDPAVMSTNEWIVDVSETLIDMEGHIEDVRAITPPEGLETSHDYALKAMDSYEYVVINYPDSLADPEIMNLCMDALEEANKNIEKAGLELNKLTD